MALSLYDVSIPVFVRGLTNLSILIDKAAAHAEAKTFEPAVLAQARLFPDMLPLTRQVQITCDTAKGAAGRLARIDIPKHEDTETTLDELKQRIAKTLDFVKSVKAEQMKGAESKTIEMKFPNRTITFTGLSYLTISRCRISSSMRASRMRCCAPAALRSARWIFSDRCSAAQARSSTIISIPVNR